MPCLGASHAQAQRIHSMLLVATLGRTRMERVRSCCTRKAFIYKISIRLEIRPQSCCAWEYSAIHISSRMSTDEPHGLGRARTPIPGDAPYESDAVSKIHCFGRYSCFFLLVGQSGGPRFDARGISPPLSRCILFSRSPPVFNYWTRWVPTEEPRNREPRNREQWALVPVDATPPVLLGARAGWTLAAGSRVQR
jgi:hypothetical protein